MSEWHEDEASSTVIEVEHLSKSYGQIRAVNDISFRVARGEVFGMLGPNGAGKTTTVEIIEGLRDADSGRVCVLGMDVSRVPAKIKQKIGVQLQAPTLLPLVSVAETLHLFAGFFERSLPPDELLDLLALRESRRSLVKNLSGGQQQRLSVALALINDPEIAFLDEPTTGLDPQARRGLWSVIEDMRGKGKTIFLTTHYMEEAERLCDRVAIIDHGRIIALDTPEELVNTYYKESAIEFEMESPPSLEVLKALPGATNAVVDGNSIIVYSGSIPTTMAAVLQLAEREEPGRQLSNLRVRRATLEDVFLKLTGRKIRE
jgi:ABC-2 type transport system ATP-binding protein